MSRKSHRTVREKGTREVKIPTSRKNARSGAPALTDALKTRLFDLRKGGFNRLYQAGEVYEFSTPESLLDLNFGEPVFVLVDRLVVSAEARTRIVDAIETAYREAGEVIFEIPESEEQEAVAGESARSHACPLHTYSAVCAAV